jgi:hypothetical protein
VALFAAGLAGGLFWSLRDRPGADHSPPAGPSAAVTPVLERLELYVQRPPVEGLRLVSGGRECDVPALEPLKPGQVFKLEGQFRRPTHWYLLWFDSAGKMTVQAHSERRQTRVEYPAGNVGVPVHPDDPAGVHLLLLVAGAVPPAAGKGRLQAHLGDVGAPPARLPPNWARVLRGAGDPLAFPAPLPSAYLDRIVARMPPGLAAVHALFLESVK